VHAGGTAVARIPRPGFCPDTEEVTGSNPVSPTSTIPGQMQFQHIASDVCARYVRERHQRDCSSASSGRCDNDHHPPATTTQLVQPWGCSLERYVIRQEQAAVNGWLGRADCRYSRTFAPPPPGRPAFTTLRSSGQWVHVHRTNIASFGPPRGSRRRWIGAHFVVWLKQTSVRSAFYGVSIVSSKLFPSIVT
jgi:hypothetical protein